MSAQTEAEDHLRYIRDVMDRSGQFSAISGFGLIVIGVLGFATGILTIVRQESNIEWLAYWIITAAVALAVSTISTTRKAGKSGKSVSAAPARKFALCLAPALLVGGALTFGLYQHELYELMPPMWLLVFGAGLTAGGTYSVGHIHRFGLAFILLGLVAILTPASYGDIWMTVGFGGLHVIMGIWVAQKYGG